MARILIGNIKGPQGPQGEQGIQGPVGPVGPQGPLPPLANNGTTEEVGKAALDAAYGKVLRDAVDQLNRDISDTWGYYMADSFNVDTAGNCILWINTYTESFLGTHPFRDDHYMLISINDNGSRLQVGISMHQGIKSRYAIPGGSWDNWV